jgi:filamentous hemagglutinin family protein
MKQILNSKRFWFVLLLCPGLWPSVAVAQIVPDGTLPNNSIINSQDNLIQIDGGTQAGGNLFHSFSEFSVPTGAQAFFNNGVNIQNILTRVTGNNISNIDGLIGANGAANLFLINPNGIIFGNNAQLAIGGSFFGSTANSILFPDGEFSANVGANGGVGANGHSPLLSVNVPIGLQMGSNSGTISVNGNGVDEIVPTENFGLAVAPGQTFALVGNGINFNGGIVTAPSGRIEIGSVANGQVAMIQTPVGWQLNYDSINQFSNINFSNRSSLFSPAVVDNPLSAVQVTGNNISLDGSQIVSLTNGDATSGNIIVNAAESLELGGTIAAFPFSAWILNQVAPGATGNSGEIQVTSPKVSINNGARIQTISQGSGAAGNVNVEAADSINITGFGLPPDFNLDQSAIDPETFLAQNTNSRIGSENFASGAGGDVSVSTKNATFLAGGQIATLAGSQAITNGGTIEVNADAIVADNSVNFNPLVGSGIASYTLGQAEGGNLNISTEKLSLTDGAWLLSWTQGQGKGGDIVVNASDSIINRGVNPLFPFVDGGITSLTIGPATSGNLEVSSKTITLAEGAQISSRTLSELIGISVAEGGTGNAGNVNINAETIELTAPSPLAPDNLTILGSVTLSSADTGNVKVSTEKLRVFDGALLTTVGLISISSLGGAEPLPGAGMGNSRDLTIHASESIEISGVNPLIPTTGSFVGTQNFGLGGSGELKVNTSRLIIQNGGGLGTSSAGAGDAGTVTIDAADIFISGISAMGEPSSLSADAFAAEEEFQRAFFASPIPTGNTGELTVNADRITVTNGGSINVEHDGTGDAGRLQINVNRLNLDNGGNINATTASGFGGNVEINVADSLQLRNGSTIDVEALGDIGDGGNLTINADTIVALENSDIIANAVGGNGGNINITTQGIFGTEFRPNLTPKSDITASSQLGVDGTVRLNTPDANPTAGLVELSSALTDPSDRIISGCAADQGNTFTITGRGGLPANPTQSLRGSLIWDDLRYFTWDESENKQVDAVSTFVPENQESMALIEATGWEVDANGTIKLVADAARVNVQSPRLPNCGDL